MSDRIMAHSQRHLLVPRPMSARGTKLVDSSDWSEVDRGWAINLGYKSDDFKFGARIDRGKNLIDANHRRVLQLRFTALTEGRAMTSKSQLTSHRS
jgi:hypothetical protein